MMRFLDSVNSYNTATVGGLAKWTACSVGGIVAWAPYGNAISLGEVLSRTIDYQDSWIVGWRIIFNEGVNWAVKGIYQGLSNGAVLITLVTQSDGTMALYAGNTLNLIGVSPSLSALHLNTEYYFEVKYSLSGGTGPISVTASFRVNGVTLISSGTGATGVMGSSLTIQDSKSNQHAFFPSNITGETLARDFYIADGQTEAGTGCVTDFVGDLSIGSPTCIYPDQDVTTQWSATGSPQFEQINEQYAEENVGSSIFSNTPGQIDNFNWQPVSPFVGAIIAVQYGVYMNKDGEGSRTVQQTVGPTAGFEKLGPDISPSDSFVYFLLCMDQDPGTNEQWTQAGFNSTQFGVNLVA